MPPATVGVNHSQPRQSIKPGATPGSGFCTIHQTRSEKRIPRGQKQTAAGLTPRPCSTFKEAALSIFNFFRSRPRQWTTCNQSHLSGDLADLAAHSPEWCNNPCLVCVGADPSPVFMDISTAPHVLVCGGTGSGKSVAINSILAQLTAKASPARLQIYAVDPKRVELAQWRRLPHLAAPVATDHTTALQVLEQAEKEMNRRFTLLDRAGYRSADQMPDMGRVLVIVDEFASLADKAGRAQLLRPLREIARMGRAAGVHLILSTQYPTASILDTQIRANCPSRLVFRLNTKQESRVAIDVSGAEMLRGRGDGLYRAATGDLHRLQGMMVSDRQIETIINHYTAQL